MGSTKAKSTRRPARAAKAPSPRPWTWLDPTASAVHGLMPQVGALVERKHQSHAAGTCDCDALLGKLDAHHMKHCVDFTTVFPVAEVVADVAKPRNYRGLFSCAVGFEPTTFGL